MSELRLDKEGFLRSETSLIQTVGRAARNQDGYVIMYADKITDSMKKTIDETERRRKLQEIHNKENNITPTTIQKNMGYAKHLVVLSESLRYVHGSLRPGSTGYSTTNKKLICM